MLKSRLAVLALASIASCAGGPAAEDTHVRTELVHLVHLPAERAATVIVERLDRRAPRVLPDPRANVILVLGTDAEIARVHDLLRELDRPAD